MYFVFVFQFILTICISYEIYYQYRYRLRTISRSKPACTWTVEKSINQFIKPHQTQQTQHSNSSMRKKHKHMQLVVRSPHRPPRAHSSLAVSVALITARVLLHVRRCALRGARVKMRTRCMRPGCANDPPNRAAAPAAQPTREQTRVRASVRFG